MPSELQPAGARRAWQRVVIADPRIKPPEDGGINTPACRRRANTVTTNGSDTRQPTDRRG
jgi:hypothetical protein